MNAFLRAYATPLVIAGILALGTTGIIMFFDLDARGLKDVHKWIGVAFLCAVVLHVAFNWRSFLMRFRQVPGVATVVLLTLIAAGVVGAVQMGMTGGERGPNGNRLALNALTHAPLSTAAPALGMTADQAIAKLKAKGVNVSGADQSLHDIAETADVELPQLLGMLLGKPGHDHGTGHEDHDHS